MAAGSKIDMVIGDLDSIPSELVSSLREQGRSFKILKREKDLSDLEAALDHAFQQNPEVISIAGAAGMRVDHTLTNIHLLEKCLTRGIECIMISDEEEIRLLDRTASVQGIPGQLISLIPITAEVKGITLRGFKYPLVRENLHRSSSRGVSNEFIGNEATIEFEEGLLLVLINRPGETG